MRPEITNDNTGKSSCHLAILMQTSIVDILNVVIMMRMTMQVLINFIKRGQEHVMKHLVTMAEGRGATATNPKMVPRQHIGSGSSGRYRHKVNCVDV